MIKEGRQTVTLSVLMARSRGRLHRVPGASAGIDNISVVVVVVGGRSTWVPLPASWLHPRV